MTQVVTKETAVAARRGKLDGCHPMRKSGRKTGRLWRGYVVRRSPLRKLMEEHGLAAGE